MERRRVAYAWIAGREVITGAVIEAAGGLRVRAGRDPDRARSGALSSRSSQADIRRHFRLTPWKRRVSDTLIAQGGLSSVGDVTPHAGAKPVRHRPPRSPGSWPPIRPRATFYSPTIFLRGALVVNAPYISLDGAFQALSTLGVGCAGWQFGHLAGRRHRQITGAVLFDSSVGNVLLNAAGDLRLIGVAPRRQTFRLGAGRGEPLSGRASWR